VTTFGQRIAQIGRLSYLGELTPLGDPVPRRHNSAQRLRSVWHTLAVPDDLATALADNPGPILLVDDRLETGWTMTVATRLLKQTGAETVLPLALATPN
jgi:ATP-dependent DNA helicase RecQ